MNTTSSKYLLAMILCFLSVGCGGGGGGANVSSIDGVIPLTGGISGTVSWLEPSKVNPSIGGVLGIGEGIRLSCALESGSVPAGMSLQSDCSVTGTPTEIETKSFTVKVSSPDATGSVSRPGSITVMGPNLAYEGQSTFQPNDYVRLSLMRPWTGPYTAQYEFDGVAPAGLSINPATGLILGNIGPGGSAFSVAVNIQTPIKSYRIVGPLFSTIPIAPRYSGFPSSISVWAGLPFSVAPLLPDGATITSASINWPINFATARPNPLPGITVDPATGVLGGTTNNGTDDQSSPVNVDLTWTVNGVSTSQRFESTLTVSWPVEITWPTACFVNSVCSSAPRIIEKAPYAFDNAIYAYELVPGEPLAQGLMLNPATGLISGTPAAPTFSSPKIKITVSQGGKTFVITRSLNPIGAGPKL
jgi:large repetitive protein